jgi:hypothetical protein
VRATGVGGGENDDDDDDDSDDFPNQLIFVVEMPKCPPNVVHPILTSEFHCVAALPTLLSKLISVILSKAPNPSGFTD